MTPAELRKMQVSKEPSSGPYWLKRWEVDAIHHYPALLRVAEAAEELSKNWEGCDKLDDALHALREVKP